MVSMATAVLSLSVSNDQFTLATTNGYKRVNGLDASLHRLGHGLSGNDTRGLKTHTKSLSCSQGTLGINRVTQSVYHTAQTLHTHGYVHNGSSPLHHISLLDEFVITEDDNTDIVWLQVKSHTLQARAEFHHFLSLDILQTVHTGDTVSNGEYTASLLQVCSGSSSQDSFLQD